MDFNFNAIQEWFGENYDNLRVYYAATGFGFSFETFVIGFAALGLGVFLLLSALKLSLLESSISFLAILSFAVSIPLTMRQNRIASVEMHLPDALKHMALVLKAGGTVENALDEVADSEGYGPLGADLKGALSRLRRGQTFDAVFLDTAEESGSILFKRTVSIIADAKRAGAGLADVMFAIADDAKDILHIQRERISRTTMHVIFLVAASMVIAPFIFGFALSVIQFIAENMIRALPNAKPIDSCSLNNTFTVFLIVQALIAAAAIGIVRNGRAGKYILYVPVVVVVTLLIFEAAKWASNAIVGGVGLVC